MQHRHLNHHELTLAAIDDVFARGQRQDWAQLRQALLADRQIAAKIVQVCRPRLADETEQRYRFWNDYAPQYLA